MSEIDRELAEASKWRTLYETERSRALEYQTNVKKTLKQTRERTFGSSYNMGRDIRIVLDAFPS